MLSTCFGQGKQLKTGGTLGKMSVLAVMKYTYIHIYISWHVKFNFAELLSSVQLEKENMTFLDICPKINNIHLYISTLVYRIHFNSEHEDKIWGQNRRGFIIIYIYLEKKHIRNKLKLSQKNSSSSTFTWYNPWSQGRCDRTLFVIHFTERSEEKSIPGHGKENTGHREHWS